MRRRNNMKHEISLSPTAIKQIEEILSSGRDVQAAVRNGHLVIWEIGSKKKYDVVVTQPHWSVHLGNDNSHYGLTYRVMMTCRLARFFCFFVRSGLFTHGTAPPFRRSNTTAGLNGFFELFYRFGSFDETKQGGGLTVLNGRNLLKWKSRILWHCSSTGRAHGC